MASCTEIDVFPKEIDCGSVAKSDAVLVLVGCSGVLAGKCEWQGRRHLLWHRPLFIALSATTRFHVASLKQAALDISKVQSIDPTSALQQLVTSESRSICDSISCRRFLVPDNIYSINYRR